jgi:hypothetical protein
MSSQLGSSFLRAARLIWWKKIRSNEWMIMSACIIWFCWKYTGLVLHGSPVSGFGRLVHEVMTDSFLHVLSAHYACSGVLHNDTCLPWQEAAFQARV